MRPGNNDRSALRKAFGLGFVSIFSYLASYYLRNLLSVATPNMLKTGEYTAEFIGLLSTVYFFVYACGQLVNGIAGDTIAPKYMILVGLSLTATAITAFPLVPFAWLQVACFVMMGIGLSMLRGPIMKLVSENLSKDISRVICTLLTVVSFIGPLVASALAILFKWDVMFIVAGLSTYFVAAVAFICLTIFERRGQLTFYRNKKSGLDGILTLFKLENFVFYMIVGGVVEIAGSAITFWIPTYLSEALKLDIITTNAIYSAITVVTSLAPFVALFVFKLIKERDITLLRFGFLISVASFVLMILVPNAWAKITFLVIAKFCLACCSSVLWSIYIPGLGSTGKVSSINGVINCTGYLSASIANAVFSSLLGLSWDGVVMVWCSIAAIGLIASLIVRNKKA
ncbi:MAG: MFS transporter [Clostridia bacterium]|nr:MFS transporter [Clostridia bacterium]